MLYSILIFFLITISCERNEQFKDPFYVPDYVYKEAQITWQRYRNWAQEDEVCLIGMVTDLHGYWNDRYKQLSYLAATDSIFNWNCLMFLGDTSLDLVTNYEEGIALLNEYSIYLSRYDGIYGYTIGNHDVKRLEDKSITNEIVAAAFMPLSQREKYNIDFNDKYCFGSFDLDNPNMRVLLVNSLDNKGELSLRFGYSSTQLLYIIDKLTSLSEGQCVAIFSHSINNIIGGWASSPRAPQNNSNGSIYENILNDFIAKKSGVNTGYGMKWDFTKVPASCKLVGNMAGHTHFDLQTKTPDGINYIVSQGYADVPASERQPNSVFTSFNSNNQVLFECIAIKPQKGEMKYFRIGAGGAQRDRTFTF